MAERFRTTDCPECSATVDLREGRTECPFCGTELPEAALIAVPDETPDHEAAIESAGAVLGTPPSESKINVIRDDGSAVILELIGGGRFGCTLMFFAAIWNAVSWTVLLGFLFAGGPRVKWFAALIPLVFVFIGAGMIYFALRMTYGRTLVLLESERLGLQHILFGFRKTSKFRLNDRSRAKLGVAYTENDSPVHRIEVTTETKTARFGTSLSLGEKQWLVDGINRFLQPPADKDNTESTASADRLSDSSINDQNSSDRMQVVAGFLPEPIEPEGFRDSVLRVDRYTPTDLQVSWRIWPPGKVRWIVGLMAGLFVLFTVFAGGAQIPGLIQNIRRGRWGAAAFGGAFVIPFLLPGILALCTLFARMFIRGTATHAIIGIGFLFPWFRRRCPIHDVESVLVADPEETNLCRITTSGLSGSGARNIPSGCVVRIRNFPWPLPLTPGHSQQTAERLGGLICSHLSRTHVELSRETRYEMQDPRDEPRG